MITRKGRTVVVASGDLLLRKRISDALRDMGHRTALAASAPEAMSMTASGTDLVILDLELADRGLISMLEEARVPVMAIGGREKARPLPACVIDLFDRDEYPQALAYRVNRALFAPGEPVDYRRRVPVSITAVFAVEGQSHTGILMNLSEGGAFLHTDEMLGEGALVELTFYLEGELVVADGVVKWSSRGTLGNLFCGSGVMFTAVAQEAAECIREFVSSRLGEVRPLEKKVV